jgi:hypothetical protein
LFLVFWLASLEASRGHRHHPEFFSVSAFVFGFLASQPGGFSGSPTPSRILQRGFAVSALGASRCQPLFLVFWLASLGASRGHRHHPEFCRLQVSKRENNSGASHSSRLSSPLIIMVMISSRSFRAMAAVSLISTRRAISRSGTHS